MIAKARIGVLLLACSLAATACTGGQRPTLVAQPTPIDKEPLQLNLPSAPNTVSPLPPAADGFTLESSVDDAILAWAIDRNVPYLDACSRVVTSPGQLCDTPTERETVRLLGPSSDEIWYIVEVAEISSFDEGTGYRVSDVTIAGR